MLVALYLWDYSEVDTNIENALGHSPGAQYHDGCLSCVDSKQPSMEPGRDSINEALKCCRQSSEQFLHCIEQRVIREQVCTLSWLGS